MSQLQLWVEVAQIKIQPNLGKVAKIYKKKFDIKEAAKKEWSVVAQSKPITNRLSSFCSEK